MADRADSVVGAGELWEEFHRELHAFLRTRVESDAVAEDILQTAFLRAHRSLLAGVLPEQPRAWLFQIVRNLTRDAHRARLKERKLAEEVAAEAAAEPGPISESDEREVSAVVARTLPVFIEGLEPAYRDALRMTELEGLTQAEAAEQSGVTLSGMKSRVQRGRKKLLDSLKRCCEFELDARNRMVGCAPRTGPGDCC